MEKKLTDFIDSNLAFKIENSFKNEIIKDEIDSTQKLEINDTETAQFYLIIEKLKNTLRYHGRDKKLLESVTSHICLMCFYAMDLMETRKYNLDILKVFKLILIHDLGELHLKHDFLASETTNNLQLKNEKEKQELSKIEKLAKFFSRSYILQLHKEYEEQSSIEARFVKVLDKIEANIHIANNYNEKQKKIKFPMDMDFTLKNLSNQVKKFPQLASFAEEVNRILKGKFCAQKTLDKWVIDDKELDK